MRARRRVLAGMKAPRAALRLYRQHEIARLAESIGYGNEVLGAVVQWAGVACGAPL